MKKIMIRLALLAEQSGEKVSEVRLEYTAEKLFPLGCADVCAALEKLLESSRRFPTIEEIKRAMGLAEPTGRDLGNRIANLIIRAMGKYGSLNSDKHREAVRLAVGPVVWDIVDKLGGWNLCCDRAADNMTSFIAQARDLVESYSLSGLIEGGEIPDSLPSLGRALEIAESQRQIEQRPEVKALAGDVSFSDLANRIVEGGIGD